MACFAFLALGTEEQRTNPAPKLDSMTSPGIHDEKFSGYMADLIKDYSKIEAECRAYLRTFPPEKRLDLLATQFLESKDEKVRRVVTYLFKECAGADKFSIFCETIMQEKDPSLRGIALRYYAQLVIAPNASQDLRPKAEAQIRCALARRSSAEMYEALPAAALVMKDEALPAICSAFREERFQGVAISALALVKTEAGQKALKEFYLDAPLVRAQMKDALNRSLGAERTALFFAEVKKADAALPIEGKLRFPVDCDFSDKPVSEFIAYMAEKGGFKISLDPDLGADFGTKLLFFHILDVTFEEALYLFCLRVQAAYRVGNGEVHIYKGKAVAPSFLIDRLNQRLDGEVTLDFGKGTSFGEGVSFCLSLAKIKSNLSSMEEKIKKIEISGKFENMKVREFLTRICKDAGLQWSIVNDRIEFK